MKKRLWLSVGIIMLVRLPFLHISFFSVDEAVSAVAAIEIMEGGLPYRDAIDHRGPLTYYFYAAVFSLLGQGNMVAIHGAYFLIHLLIAFVLYELASRYLASRDAASWAVLIYACISGCNYFTEGLAAHTEYLLAFCIGLSWLIFYSGRWSMRLLLCGLLTGLAISSKQVALLDLGVFLLAVAWENKGIGWKKKAWESLLFLLGASLTILLFALIFYQRAALQDLIFYAWTYNTAYYLPELGLETRLLNAVKLIGSFLLDNLVLLLMAYLSLTYFFTEKKFSHVVSKVKKHLILLSWLLAAAVAGLAGGRAFTHYLIPLMLPLAMWSGQITHYFLNERFSAHPYQRQGLHFLIALLLILSLGLSLREHMHMLGGDPSVSEYREVSDYLSARLEDERIFVWGFAPEIYLLSEQRPASRFTFCNPLSGHLPAANEEREDTQYAIVPGAWDSLAKDFEAHPPAYIIDTQEAGFKSYGKFPLKGHAFMREYLGNYALDTAYINLHPQDSIRLYKRI